MFPVDVCFAWEALPVDVPPLMSLTGCRCRRTFGAISRQASCERAIQAGSRLALCITRTASSSLSSPLRWVHALLASCTLMINVR